MTISFPTSHRHRHRLGLLLLLSLLLHALMLGGLPSWTIPANSNAPQPLTASLRPLPSLPAPPAESTPEPRPEMEPKAQPRTESQSRVEPLPPPPQVNATSELAPSPPAPLEPAALPVPTPLAPAPPADANADVARLLRAIPASSATLQYKVVASDPRTEPPRMYYGNATLAWKADRERYDLDLQVRVSILIASLNALSSHSEGGIQESGLVPRRYTETPRGRSTLAVNFNRDERNSVTFSASTNNLPLMVGLQDRLSLLMQVGAIVRANPALLGSNVPGAGVEIPLASVRGNTEVWRFVSAGVETVETGSGNMVALHLRRAPRQKADLKPDDQSMDLWLSLASGSAEASGTNNGLMLQNAQAYPVKIRFSDANATSYELTLEKIE